MKYMNRHYYPLLARIFIGIILYSSSKTNIIKEGMNVNFPRVNEFINSKKRGIRRAKDRMVEKTVRLIDKFFGKKRLGS